MIIKFDEEQHGPDDNADVDIEDIEDILDILSDGGGVSMPGEEPLPCGMTYTAEPDKIKWEFVPDKDIIFKIVVFEDNTISVVTDDIRGRGCGLRGRYQFIDLLELAKNIKTHLGLNPKFEVVQGEE